jgi:toxin FitB
MYLLDTNVISELRKSDSKRIAPAVERWVNAQTLDRLCLSVISVFELERGVLLVERRDQVQGGLLRKWLNEKVFPAFENRIVPIDTRIARTSAALHVPNPMPERDSLIAATALAHHMTVVTRDTEPFQRCGVNVINPWETAERAK